VAGAGLPRWAIMCGVVSRLPLFLAAVVALALAG
jgi:hypothetical protein